MKVALADFNFEGAQNAAKELNASGHVALAIQVDVGDWESQKTAFETAVQAFGRINYVFPIAGITERPWLPFQPCEEKYVKPDLSVMDVNATGALYTCALGVQHFQRQKPDKYGFRGKGERSLSLLDMDLTQHLIQSSLWHLLVAFTTYQVSPCTRPRNSTRPIFAT